MQPKLGRTFIVGTIGLIASLVLPGSIAIFVLYFTLGLVLLMIGVPALAGSISGSSRRKEIR